MIRSRDRLSWRLPVYRWLTPEGVDMLVVLAAVALFVAVACAL